MEQTALKSQLSKGRKYEKKLHLMLKKTRLGLIIEGLSFNIIPSCEPGNNTLLDSERERSVGSFDYVPLQI